MEVVEVRGERIPVLGFGTWQLTGGECREGVRHALTLGYRHVDTARMYQNERQVGRALAEAPVDRDEVFVTTKIGPQDLDARGVKRATNESLDRLGLDYVDLLLIHWPSDRVPLAESLAAMREQQEAGRVRLLGVSNFTPSLVAEALAHAPIVCNQVEYHPFLDQSHLRRQALDEDLLLAAYSPLAKGRVATNETLAAVGRRHGKTAAQVALRWLVQQGAVAALPRSSDPDHRAANLDIFDFHLDEEDMDRVTELAGDRRLIDPPFAPDWER